MAMSIDAAGIAARLGKGQRSGNGWKARCPAHDDKHASLVIYDRPGGGVNVKCMADCEQGSVIAKLKAMRLWPQPGVRKDPNRAQASKDRKRREEIVEVLDRVPVGMPEPDWGVLFTSSPTTVYDYRDTSGNLLGYVARHDSTTGDKRILPVSPCRYRDGSIGWDFRAPANFTLYGLEQLAQRPDAEVIIVEGEKAANAGRRLFPDAIILSWRGGAGAVDKNDFGPVQQRRVTIIPDADGPGRRAGTSAVVKALAAGALVAELIDMPPDFPKGWDIADPLPTGWSLDALLEQSSVSAVTDEQVNVARALVTHVISAADLVKMDVPPREYIVEPFITTQSLNMLYAARGIGKTWIALTLALAVARGDEFLGYHVEHEWPVLYIDGEMPLPDIQQRLIGLDPNPPANLMILPSELLYRDDLPINLQNAEDRQRIDQLLETLATEGRRPALVIIDNLSSMSGGIDENDNSALDQFLQWLVGLRHAGSAILLIHHAGKSGSQRGASRREDFLDTSIELKKPSQDRDGEETEIVHHQGAHLILSFAKTRGKPPEPDELELKLVEHGAQLIWTIGEVRTIDRSIKLLRTIWESSSETQKDLAANVGVTAARISQLCGKLRKKGLIEPSPSLKITIDGKETLVAHFPEIEQRMLKQGELFHRTVI